MKTANLMNLSAVKGNFTAPAEASKKLQEENLEVAEVFAGLMNQTIGFSNSVVKDTSSNTEISKTDKTRSVANSYERYSYKEKQIESADSHSIADKIEESSDALEQAEIDVISAISEEYGISEEAIQEVLENMGLNVLDLLNPQNLVNFIVELTGVASGEELLVDGNFLKIMESLGNLANGLAKELGVDMEGLQQLLAQMEMVTADTQLPDSAEEVLASQMENWGETTVEAVDEHVTVDSAKEVAENIVVPEQTDDVEEKNDVEAEMQKDDTEVGVQTSKETTVHSTTEEDTLAGDQNSEQNSFMNQNSNSSEALVTNQTTVDVSQTADVPQTQFSSYVSTDTMQIMEQIVQQMRVNVTPEVSSMEMQLNPENLGKVFVQISSEEGVVNAHFRATNEAVKEALETQIITLRENLNQAGVKVDAIEVTIASHEFERNLEQNHQSSEQQVESQDTNAQRRRNITIDSLDELSGIMTEEETLVAQIMKDNGNSIDLTA